MRAVALRQRGRRFLRWVAGGHPRITAFTDWLAKALGCAAVIVGGWWTYSLFISTGDGIPHLVLRMNADVLASGNERVLVLHLVPKNVGKVPLEKSPRFDVCINPLSPDPSPGTVLEPQQRVDTGKQRCRWRIDVLRKYTDGYFIDPGTDYDEVEAIVLPPGLYQVEAELDTDNDPHGSAFNARQIVKIPPLAGAAGEVAGKA